MNIVINIDEDMLTEEEIEACIKLAKTDFSDVTVLPKGHGDLIDRDCFANKYESCGNEYCEYPDECEECNSRIIDKYDVDSIPAVIPADK